MECPNCGKPGFNCYESRKATLDGQECQEQRRVCRKDEGGCGHTQKYIKYPPITDEVSNLTTRYGSNHLEKIHIQ